MADDKSKREKHERPPLAHDDDYGFRHLAERNGITTDQVRGLLDRHGNDHDRYSRETDKPK
ncbi:DUF3606 domain-containing protein [Pseudaminobacter arsenicus]|uniref:DUF3606 domain-containing protein n=1 Tax=Borborobacter arsenicus TaxID=1851146 RepID=A0A432UZZ9_9HYPH|nr:DUF3606 domain-containing protein [Pseudaminobacter arsenicus]